MATIFYPGRPPIDVTDVEAAQLMAHVRRVGVTGEHAWLNVDGAGDAHVLFVGPNIPISVTMSSDAVPKDFGLAGPDSEHAAGAIDAYYDRGRRADGS